VEVPVAGPFRRHLRVSTTAPEPPALSFTVLVLDTGRYYVLYGPTGGSTSVIAGVIVGDGTASGSTFASTNLHDFSLEAGVISLGTLTSTFAAKTSFNGSVDRSPTRAAKRLSLRAPTTRHTKRCRP
jgi:hypothetical protein